MFNGNLENILFKFYVIMHMYVYVVLKLTKLRVIPKLNILLSA